MRVLVPIKRVIDYTVKIRVRPDKLGVDKKTVKMSTNPFCDIAVEEAVRLKEAGHASELIAVTIGPKKASEQLRTAMAVGVDRSIHIVTEHDLDTHIQPLAVSKILAKVIEKESPHLVIMGKQAIDDDCAQTGPMLAGRLGWPQATFASQIKVLSKTEVEVLREVDTGGQRLKLTLPAVITCDLRLNEPRFATLQNIMKAKKKPLEEINLDDMGIKYDPTLQYMEIKDPPVRKGGVFVESVEELFEKLKALKLF